MVFSKWWLIGSTQATCIVRNESRVQSTMHTMRGNRGDRKRRFQGTESHRMDNNVRATTYGRMRPSK
jgi:hypothetical protein